MINFEVVTVKCVSIDGVVYTVANIYNNINNRKNIRKQDFDLVYQKLEGTKILCGDFNGSSFLQESNGSQNRSEQNILNFIYDAPDLVQVTSVDTLTYINA